MLRLGTLPRASISDDTAPSPKLPFSDTSRCVRDVHSLSASHRIPISAAPTGGLRFERSRTCTSLSSMPASGTPERKCISCLRAPSATSSWRPSESVRSLPRRSRFVSTLVLRKKSSTSLSPRFPMPTPARDSLVSDVLCLSIPTAMLPPKSPIFLSPPRSRSCTVLSRIALTGTADTISMWGPRELLTRLPESKDRALPRRSRCVRTVLPSRKGITSPRLASSMPDPRRSRCVTVVLARSSSIRITLSPGPIDMPSRSMLLTVPLTRPSYWIPHTFFRYGSPRTASNTSRPSSLRMPLSLRSRRRSWWPLRRKGSRSRRPCSPTPTPKSDSLVRLVQRARSEMAMAPSAGPTFMLLNESSLMFPSRRACSGTPERDRTGHVGAFRACTRRRPSS
mmetsp:Transcript_47414/g.115468  ORF Transcript_47414/g.115468 Transcript_47414/m.115468 type:complete len:395 (-) Transcript_47414:2320-3504(-)